MCVCDALSVIPSYFRVKTWCNALFMCYWPWISFYQLLYFSYKLYASDSALGSTNLMELILEWYLHTKYKDKDWLF